MEILPSNTSSVGVLLFFLGGFVVSLVIFLVRKQNRFLGKKMGLTKIQSLSWGDFELMCAELFRSMGWKTQNNTKSGADGGVDIHMRKRRKTAIVQCKKYGRALVTIKVIREMYGLMHEYNADEVFVVTSGRFTKECFVFARGKNIALIDGELLARMVK